ncbi:hypothetical protein SAMN05444166_7558 [Singulisphaera sp. GP187]|uniref:hypothetical protein n=1 Tax=Singulisphaera sp. GP187 TaxID=1882752 RepID=UPI00092C24C1|nr:hypothetical protein [Singulisphaera sp. GP187]SIO65059.1 hypothetical protein SAMN05444166_7558 [Singulisphaera sp. GP187]
MNIRSQAMLLLLPLLLGSDWSDSDTSLAMVVKDAISSNASRWNSGALKVRLTFYSKPSAMNLEMDADVTWLGRQSLVAYRLRDITGNVIGSPSPDVPLNEQPINYIMRSPTSLYTYHSKNKSLVLYDPKRKEPIVEVFAVSPVDFWEYFHGGSLTAKRKWVDMIGPNPIFPDSTYSLARLDNHRVNFIRQDSGGGMLELTSSMAVAGNVTKAAYKNRSGSPSFIQNYDWRTDRDGVAVLDKCEIRASRSGDLADADLSLVAEFKDIDLKTKVLPAKFTEDSLFRLLPPGFTFVNQVTGKRVRNGGLRTETDSRLKSVAKDLKRHGFLAR